MCKNPGLKLSFLKRQAEAFEGAGLAAGIMGGGTTGEDEIGLGEALGPGIGLAFGLGLALGREF